MAEGGNSSEIGQLDKDFQELAKKLETDFLPNLSYREKLLATEWLVKLRNTKGDIAELKLRNRFTKHFLETPKVFSGAKFKDLPANFQDSLEELRQLLPKTPDEALNPTKEEKLSYISQLFANLPDRGQFLASLPVPRAGSFYILLTSPIQETNNEEKKD
ncbi:uncharacterized protein LOC119632427 [Glossina fuscipes]|uniref:Uncharacterized protein LOC119632427 n=1 Tax=Glossina fuscipes TaxID=7396 RepID=A0A8U0W7I9_9MUSC|nr:uncharacterized protein LOC119632427 [Glossina fuscipes]